MTPSTLWFAAAGEPPHPYTESLVEGGHCATCATPLSRGVPIQEIVTVTFAQHGDYLRYGTHVCPACAWLYGLGKGNPGNIVAAGDRYWRPMIGHDSATDQRPQWVSVLQDIATMPLDTPVAGVMTSDPKPRLWPRAELCTVGAFGLYLHCPDYNLSEFRRFDLRGCLVIVQAVTEAIIAGWPKRLIATSLFGDYKRASKAPVAAARIESSLAPLRATPEFIPALLIAGVRKK